MTNQQRIPHGDDPLEVRRAIQRLKSSFFDESSDVDHDATTNFVAAEHVDHSAVSILAGTGLTGGGTIEANRTLALSHLGIEALADPGADRIAFWDESENAFKWLTVGANLEIADTTLNVTGIVIDHGALAGLGDDDHPHYLLADGTRNLTGNLAVDAAVTIDGRDLSVDGDKLDGIEALADVTDAANVAAAGAAMSGGAFHDTFSDFVANEHMDTTAWAANLMPSSNKSKDLGSAALKWRTLYCYTLQVIGNTLIEWPGITIENTKPAGPRVWYIGPSCGVLDSIALRDQTAGVNLIECDFDAKIRLLGRTRVGTAATSYHATSALTIAQDVVANGTYTMALGIQGSYKSTTHSAYAMWVGATLQGNDGGQVNGFYAACIVNVDAGETINAIAGKLGTLAKTGAGTVTTVYGMYLGTQTIGSTNWQIYNQGGNNFLGTDNSKSYFGTGLDASVYYDDTDLVIDPDENGSGKVLIGATADDEIDAGSYSVGGVAGVSGSFTTTDGKTVTVTNGLVTSIV